MIVGEIRMLSWTYGVTNRQVREWICKRHFRCASMAEKMRENKLGWIWKYYVKRMRHILGNNVLRKRDGEKLKTKMGRCDWEWSKNGGCVLGGCDRSKWSLRTKVTDPR